MRFQASTIWDRLAALGNGSGALPVRADLVVALARCWIAVAALYLAFNFATHLRDGWTDGAGEPLGADFLNNWAAAVLAWSGRASAVYDWRTFHEFQKSIVGAGLDFYHYSYPPVALLLTAPLALVPYPAGLALWLGASWLAFFAALRLALPMGALLLALATPAVFVNAIGGQNGAWSAALMGGGLCLLRRRPAVAGMLFGLLVYKPQLALLIPVALAAGRQWTAFASSAVTACVLAALSVAIFGFEIWGDYLRNASILREAILEHGSGVWHRMMSVFVFARRLGLDATGAYVAQALVALPVAAAVAYVWFRGAPERLRCSLLVLGTFLVTPYLQDYDLVAGAFVVAWLMAEARETPRRHGTAFIVSALVLIGPLVMAPLGKLTGFSAGPLFLLPAFILTLAMALSRRAPPQEP